MDEKFGLSLQSPDIKQEFKKLLNIFFVVIPIPVEKIRENIIQKNIFGLPQTQKKIMKVYNLLKKRREHIYEMDNNLLDQIPFCYLSSYVMSWNRMQNLRELNSIGDEFKPLGNTGNVIETLLKKSIPVQESVIGKIWFHIIYNHENLLTSDYDQFTDPQVLEGTISLGELKKKALTGDYNNFELLISAYKNHNFKLPSENFVAQEATEWLALYTKAFHYHPTASQFSKLYAQALTEKWFGNVSKYSSGFSGKSYKMIELTALKNESRQGNLAARGLLSLPPFCNSKEVLSEELKKHQLNADLECIVS